MRKKSIKFKIQDNKAKIACICVLPITVFSLVLQILVANRFAVQGTEYAELLAQKSQLQSDISKLELEKHKLSSIALVRSRAYDLGFVEMTAPLLAIGSPSVAVLPDY